MRKSCIVFAAFLLVLLFSSACAKQPAAPAAPEKPAEAVINKPAEVLPPKVEQPKQTISAEVQELLAKRNTRVKNIFYRYKGPETDEFLYDFYVKGDKIKYSPIRNIKTFDNKDSFNFIFIDNTGKTAQSYCLGICVYPGKKDDLNYDESYISTIFDWVEGLTKAEKLGEEVIDDRNSWKVDTNKGILWVDTFYGIPLKAESNGETYRFQQISVNSVADGDVKP